jgi:HAMP domain-containing protein
MNDNSFVEFATRPITAAILLVALGVLIWGAWRRVLMQRRLAEARARDETQVNGTNSQGSTI